MDIHANRKAVQELNALYTDLREGKKKDDTYLEPDMKKRQANNEKARKELAKGPQMKNPHFEENGWDSVKSFASAYKAVHEGIRDEDPEKGTKERKARLEKKRGMKLDDHPQYKKEEVENVDEMIDPKGAARMDAAKKKKKVDVFAYDRKLQAQGKLKGKKLPPAPTNEALDPVGKEDKDIDNDGDVDSSDKYLHKRRKAIGKAIKKKMSEGVRDIDPEKGTAERKARLEKKRGMKLDDHPQYKKESFSDWRSELVEVIDKEEQDKQIKEKNVKNKVTIDPELKLEQVAEELGGELLEWIELDEETYEMIKEGLSIDQQMKISRDHNRKSPEEKKAANMKALGAIKKIAAKKDTRTDAQKMTDATGPRPGSRYRGD